MFDALTRCVWGACDLRLQYFLQVTARIQLQTAGLCS